MPNARRTRAERIDLIRALWEQGLTYPAIAERAQCSTSTVFNHTRDMPRRVRRVSPEKDEQPRTQPAQGHAPTEALQAPGLDEKTVREQAEANPDAPQPVEPALAPETITAIRQLRKAGQTIVEIAQALGISKVSVWKYTPDMRRPRRPPITPEQHEQIQKRYIDGDPIDDIARTLGISTAAVVEHTAGLHNRGFAPLSPETIKAIQRRNRQGLTPFTIARELGISRPSVYRHRKQAPDLPPIPERPSGSKQPLTPETIAAIRQRREAGQTARVIARALGISTSSVTKYARDIGGRTFHVLTPEEHRTIQERYANGEPIDDIARSLGINRDTVVNHTAGLHNRRVPPLSPDTIQAIRERSRQGVTGIAIAQEFGISTATVSRHRK